MNLYYPTTTNPPILCNDPVAASDIPVFIDGRIPIGDQRWGQLQTNGLTLNQQPGNVNIGNAGVANHFETVTNPDPTAICEGSDASVLMLRSLSTDANTAGAIRTEVSFRGSGGTHDYWIQPLTSYWIVFRYWLSGSRPVGGHIAPFQLHDARSNPPQGEPPCAGYLNIVNGQQRLIGRRDTTIVFQETYAQLFDQWVDCCINFRFDHNGGTGFFRMWENGIQRANYSGNFGYSTNPDPPRNYYHKLGQYFYGAGSGLPSGQETMYLAYSALIEESGYTQPEAHNHLVANTCCP